MSSEQVSAPTGESQVATRAARRRAERAAGRCRSSARSVGSSGSTPSQKARVSQRSGRVKQVFTLLCASTAAIGFFAVNLVSPATLVTATATATLDDGDQFAGAVSQSYVASGSYALSVGREGYLAEKKPVPLAPAATHTGSGWRPPAVTPDPGSAQAIAAELVAARGWSSDDFNCLVALWSRESGWRINAHNPSGAYGIPQALPGSKMASAGADWATNPETQIRWGLGYIAGRYGTPCGAWSYSQSSGWY